MWKITTIEKRPNRLKFGLFLLTLTNGTQTVQRAFGIKWFPTLCLALDKKKIKVGDEMKGTIVNSIFKYDPPESKTEIRINKKGNEYIHFLPRY